MESTQKTVKTIADIAKLAGVSPSTVSRALNDSPLIGKETKKRIRAIAEEHRFVVHQGARNLRLKQHRTMTLIVPNVPSDMHFVNRAMFMDMLRGIILAVAEYAYTLQIGQPRKYQFGDDFRQLIGLTQTDSLIVPAYQPIVDQLTEIVGDSLPIVLWGVAENHQYCSVDCDNAGGGQLATEHLIKMGRRRIAFLGAQFDQQLLEISLRYQGYAEALQKAGLTPDPALCAYGNYTQQSGFTCMQTLLHQEPELDAVFVCSDLMAIGAMEAIRECGKSVPCDISIVGFDDIPSASHCNPPLTTVRQDAFKIGETLIHNLVQYMKHPVSTNSIVPVELVVRESSAPAL